MKVHTYEKAFLAVGGCCWWLRAARWSTPRSGTASTCPADSRRGSSAGRCTDAALRPARRAADGPNRYEVVMIGQAWSFNPAEIRVPAGAEVTFTATSPDVLHGLNVEGTRLNMMLIPGQISRHEPHLPRAGRAPDHLPRVLRHRPPLHGREGDRRMSTSTSIVVDPDRVRAAGAQRRVIRWTLYIGYAALIAGVFHGLAQALSYANIDILRYFPGLRGYYQGLTVHGVANVLIFTFSFSNGFLPLMTARALSRPLCPRCSGARSARCWSGNLMVIYAVVTNQASVLYTSYAPLQAHWTYYLGLALVVVSTWLALANMLLVLRGWRATTPARACRCSPTSRWSATSCGSWRRCRSPSPSWGSCSPGRWG
jgi:plastocyanin